MSESRHPADEKAFNQMAKAVPLWDGIDTAANALGLDSNVLLHAGPPFASAESISKPILNSACVAAVYEGLASDFDQAETMIRGGEILLKPAQDHAMVTPLATMVSASMPMHRVIDQGNPANRIYAPLNGGMRAPMRLGLRSETVLEHIRWLNSEYAELLRKAMLEPVEIIPIAVEALRAGDDCHGRTPEGTRLLMAEIKRRVSDVDLNDNLLDFIDNSPPLFLNLWMAASKCLMMAASGIEGSSFVTAAGANGVDSGIQISGLPGQWFQANASPPHGRFDVELPTDRALPAIGDSAVVETLGLGAMALQFSPEQEKNFRDFLPRDYDQRAARLMCGPHPGLEGLDCRLGLCARTAVEAGLGPIVGLGILDITGEKGRLGGGIYDMPVIVFDEAVGALNK